MIGCLRKVTEPWGGGLFAPIAPRQISLDFRIVLVINSALFAPVACDPGGCDVGCLRY